MISVSTQTNNETFQTLPKNTGYQFEQMTTTILPKELDGRVTSKAVLYMLTHILPPKKQRLENIHSSANWRFKRERAMRIKCMNLISNSIHLRVLQKGTNNSLSKTKGQIILFQLGCHREETNRPDHDCLHLSPTSSKILATKSTTITRWCGKSVQRISLYWRVFCSFSFSKSNGADRRTKRVKQGHPMFPFW